MVRCLYLNRQITTRRLQFGIVLVLLQIFCLARWILVRISCLSLWIFVLFMRLMLKSCLQVLCSLIAVHFRFETPSLTTLRRVLMIQVRVHYIRILTLIDLLTFPFQVLHRWRPRGRMKLNILCCRRPVLLLALFLLQFRRCRWLLMLLRLIV